MVRFLVLALVALPSIAWADAPVGQWSQGETALSVQEGGRFDWTAGGRVTDGEWRSRGALVSLDSQTGSVTYAWSVENNTLTLTDPSGAQIVFSRKRSSAHTKKRLRS